ncbi:aldehyde dehydrogenase type III-PG [Cladochytrium replicatum]|nr:aldehyde dehydrogenase type III-PG [Cladochytrium replicatum]
MPRPGVVSPLVYDNVEDIPQVVAELRREFNTGFTLPIEYRRKQLIQIGKFLENEKDGIIKAVNLDLGRSAGNTMSLDITPTLNEVIFALQNLEDWAADEQVATKQVWGVFDRALITKHPLGVVLVIGAWNYPIQVQILPIVSAIAAGCCVVLKPSEVASHSAHFIAQVLNNYVDSRMLRVINGAVPQTTRLLECKFDHIFFTGNGTVGKIVMQAGAKQLTPVTLELGGKSPVVIDRTVADVAVVARRILWGKFMNCGQTCISPDFVLVHKDVKEKFVAAIPKVLEDMYGPLDKIKTNSDWGRLIHTGHTERLIKLIDRQLKANPATKVLYGNIHECDDTFLAPTVLVNVGFDATTNPIMEDELFGPILPIIEFDGGADQVIKMLNSRDTPLVEYIFSGDEKFTEKILRHCVAGNAMVNDTMMFMIVHDLPFGGVGASGAGNYHGKAGFDTFTKKRSTHIRPQGLDAVLDSRYPPLTDAKRFILEKLQAKPIPTESALKTNRFLKVYVWRALFKPLFDIRVLLIVAAAFLAGYARRS